MRIHRRYIRWQVNRKVKVSLEGKLEPLECAIYDLSLSGAKISLKQKLAQDTFLKLVFSLSDELSFEVTAWVAWHRTIDGTNIYGLYFSRLRDIDKENIFRFIHNNFPEQIKERWWPSQEEKAKGGEDMDDRRVFARFPVNFPLRFIDLKGNKEGTAQAQDISAKGVGLLVKEELRSQTPLEMWLEIPDRGAPLYARGEVVWSKMLAPREYQVGVNLEKADLMGMSRILRVT